MQSKQSHCYPVTLLLTPCTYRLAFKLAYDQVVLGEGDDDEEVIECLEEYETSWYLGSDTDEEWKDAIKKQKQQLFSLMFNAAEVSF